MVGACKLRREVVKSVRSVFHTVFGEEQNPNTLRQNFVLVKSSRIPGRPRGDAGRYSCCPFLHLRHSRSTSPSRRMETSRPSPGIAKAILDHCQESAYEIRHGVCSVSRTSRQLSDCTDADGYVAG